MADPAGNEQEQNSSGISRQLQGPVAGGTGKEGIELKKGEEKVWFLKSLVLSTRRFRRQWRIRSRSRRACGTRGD